MIAISVCLLAAWIGSRFWGTAAPRIRRQSVHLIFVGPGRGCLLIERGCVPHKRKRSVARGRGREMLVGGVYAGAVLAPLAVELDQPVDRVRANLSSQGFGGLHFLDRLRWELFGGTVARPSHDPDAGCVQRGFEVVQDEDLLGVKAPRPLPPSEPSAGEDDSAAGGVDEVALAFDRERGQSLSTVRRRDPVRDRLSTGLARLRRRPGSKR